MKSVHLKQITGEQNEFLDLQKVLESAPGFSHRTTGAHPAASAAQSMITALPPNKTYQDKFVFIAYCEEVPVGCIDLVRGYPDASTAWIGLLLINENLHRYGLGRLSYKKIEEQIRLWPEITNIMLSVVAKNSVAIPFWQKMGFSLTGEKKPYKHGNIESEVILMRKVLSS